MGGDELMEFLTVRMKDSTKEVGPRDVDLWLSQAHVWQSEGVLDDVVFDDSDVSDSDKNIYHIGTEEKQTNSVKNSLVKFGHYVVEHTKKASMKKQGLVEQ